MKANKQPDNAPPGPLPEHPSHKQEKVLVVVCIVVAAIMLLSLSRYMFR